MLTLEQCNLSTALANAAVETPSNFTSKKLIATQDINFACSWTNLKIVSHTLSNCLATNQLYLFGKIRILTILFPIL
jgi:hypothetical protein